MTEKAYDSVSRDDLILRDVLARDRTILANERTFLAYVRTVLTLVVGGASFIHFFDWAWVVITGSIMVAISPFLIGFGLWRYLLVRRDMQRLQ
ncbi:MAG: DUF202 domain-containing protein [Acidobacteriota bacterium]